MNRTLWLSVVAAFVIGLVAIFYPRQATEPPVPLELPEPPPSVAPTPSFEAAPEPVPAFVAEIPPEPLPPLPALDDSDPEALAALAEAAGEALVERHLVPDSLIRKLVTTVDSLSGEALWMKVRVVPAIDGRLRVTGSEDAPVLAEANFARYAAVVGLVDAIDVAAVVGVYRRYYPLLQQAYEELGYPGRQFHNRALEVIDHLLDTPNVQGPIRLEQPHVLYRFADPKLESLSAGQKVMIRIGPDHAATIRAKLVELRTALGRLSDTPGAGPED